MIGFNIYCNAKTTISMCKKRHINIDIVQFGKKIAHIEMSERLIALHTSKISFAKIAVISRNKVLQ